jgi:AcrR family transcriptional regulator
MQKDARPTDQSGSPNTPRKPERANGRKSYDALLDAAERLLMREGPDALTIHRLSREAGVPTASVYHFFPSPAAISVGLSERYLTGFAELVGRPFDNLADMSWQDIVATLIDRAVDYYIAHPYAQRLVLGSDHSWHIRSADLANNRLLAQSVAALLEDSFPGVAPDALLHAVTIGITLGDAVFTLSIFDHGQITRACADDAKVAICGYLSQKFNTNRPAAR